MAINKRFQNEGLIRNNNLSDVQNTDTALSSLLNDLVAQDDVVFTARDLDCISFIATTNLRSQEFQKLANVSVKRSELNEEDQVIAVTAQPFVTIKNRIDGVVVTTDDPPFFNGGDGLPAEFWEQSSLNTGIDKNSTGDDIFLGPPVDSEESFWDNGYFQFSGNIGNLDGSNGGVQWDGFYVPDATGTTEFNFVTSGLFMLELENTNGVLEVVKSIYQSDISITSLETISGTEVDISADDYKHVARSAVIDVGETEPVEVTQVNYDQDENRYYLELDTEVNFAAGEQFTVSVAEKLGTDSFRVQYPFTRLQAFQPRRIRITLWFPGTEQYFYKVLDANFSTANRSGNNLPFWYLYTSINTNTEPGSFKEFYEQRLRLGGGTIGPESVADSTEYNTVASISPLSVKYEPPMLFTEIVTAIYEYQRNQGEDVLSTTGASPLTSGIEIGNRVLGTGIPLDTYVTEISDNSVVVLNNTVSENITDPVTFIDHRGIVGIFTATSTNTVVSVSDTEKLREGMVVITQSNTDYVRITEINSGTDFTTDTALGLTEASPIFVYQDKGIQNNSLDAFCTGVIGKQSAGAGGSAGSNTIELEDVDNISVDMVVQSTPYVADSTSVTAVDTGSSTVTLDKALEADIIEGITVVFSPSGTTLNKEQCVVPLNTAPPFTGTDRGLATTGNVVLNDGDLNVVSLAANNSNSIKINPGPNYDKKIELNIQGTQYYILGSST